MKILRGLLLSAVLSLVTLAAEYPQTRMAEPQPVVEYNVGFCGSESFTVVHAVLKDDNLDFAYHLEGGSDEPVAVVKDEGIEHVVFSFKPEPKDKDGNVKFHSEGKYHESKLVINGLIRNESIVGVMLVDGHLGHVIYGRVGKIDDMVKEVPVGVAFCADLHSISAEALPQALADWLLQQGKARKEFE